MVTTKAGGTGMTRVRSLARRVEAQFSQVAFSRSPLGKSASARYFRTHVRPTDAFVVGHPKSGNTWVAYMLAVVKEGGDPDDRINVSNVGGLIPTAHRFEQLHVIRSRNLLRSYERLAEPRIFRNEQPVHPELYPRTVYLVRDPRSVLVSYFHHYTAEFDDPDMTLDKFV